MINIPLIIAIKIKNKKNAPTAPVTSAEDKVKTSTNLTTDKKIENEMFTDIK